MPNPFKMCGANYDFHALNHSCHLDSFYMSFLFSTYKIFCSWYSESSCNSAFILNPVFKKKNSNRLHSNAENMSP